MTLNAQKHINFSSIFHSFFQRIKWIKHLKKDEKHDKQKRIPTFISSVYVQFVRWCNTFRWQWRCSVDHRLPWYFSRPIHFKRMEIHTIYDNVNIFKPWKFCRHWQSNVSKMVQFSSTFFNSFYQHYFNQTSPCMLKWNENSFVKWWKFNIIQTCILFNKFFVITK